jgi:uncharacterized membrane protein
MTWGSWFSLRQHARQSLWLVPLLGAFAGWGIAVLSIRLEGRVPLPQSWTFSSNAAETVLATIVGAMIGLVGFVVTVTVLMVQTAIGTFSARYLRLLYRDGLLKAVLGVLVGTFTFSFVLLRKVEDDKVPDLGVAVSGVFVLLGTVLFLVFFSRFLQRLRPVAVASIVSRMGIKTFVAETPAADSSSRPESTLPPGPGEVVTATRSGVIQAVYREGLLEWAEKHGCAIVFRLAIGDFAFRGAPLAEVRGAPAHPGTASELEGMIAFGRERTIEQDPAFAIRIMVDIANRALSPAVNDPTTAGQLLDFIEDMLVVIGRTDFSARGVFNDPGGVTRLVLPSRGWDDYLSLGVTEIRMYGGSSLQVVRRLRALLQHLHEAVLPEHRGDVDDELARLEATVRQEFGDSVDLDRAIIGDRQGIGGPFG